MPIFNSRTTHFLLALTFSLTLTAMLALPAQAQTYTVLYTFTGGTDGGWPYAGVVADNAGNLYGTTEVRGNNSACGAFHGCGVVFKLDPSGNETVLHTFEGNVDGRQPVWGNLLRNNAGDIIDTTQYGGMNGQIGLGTIYALTAEGKEIIVHRFQGPPNDGEEPQTGLIVAKDGSLYGTTAGGGNGFQGGCGTIYRLTKTGQFSIFHNFKGGDGCSPAGGLVMDSQGNLYGTANSGGAGYGNVFKITPSGVLTVLHSFTGIPDGALPSGILTIDKAGNLYGTTLVGGSLCTTVGEGCGVVFKIDTQGNETILYRFLLKDGIGPMAGVVVDAAGNLYGSTTGAADYNWGSLFKLDTQGNYTKLHDFAGAGDGASPFGTMTWGGPNTLYGTTYLGGLADGCDYGQGCGVVFKLTLQ